MVRQGERGSSMFIIVLGKVHVVVTDSLKNRGEPLQVATLLPGDFFGEIALITGERVVVRPSWRHTRATGTCGCSNFQRMIWEAFCSRVRT